MQWHGPRYPGDFPSLGYLLIAWAERHLVIPDGPKVGEPWQFTQEQGIFQIRHYALIPESGARLRRRSALIRPKGWGKSPLLGGFTLQETLGPCVFLGWASKGDVYRCSDNGCPCGWVYRYREGEPMGGLMSKHQATAYCQLAAVSEDQTDNTYTLVKEMIESGPLADMPGMDTGLTRTFLPYGGKIEPVTASAGAREGQRITFAVLDETHLWKKSNKGDMLASTLRRNLGKMKGTSVETTNAPSPSSWSVAEDTLLAHRNGTRGVFVDHREPSGGIPSLKNVRQLKRALKEVYGDATWIDIDRIIEEIQDPATDPADAVRFYLNVSVAAANAFTSPEEWNALRTEDRLIAQDAIALGFDGSAYADSTALIAVRIRDALVQPIAIWSKPSGEEGEGWSVPRHAVMKVVRATFKRYRVFRLAYDPPYWYDEGDQWKHEFGEDVVKEFHTNRPRVMGPAIDRAQESIRAKAFTHTGNEELSAHVRNARVDIDRGYKRLTKPVRQGDEKIDAAVAFVIGLEARANLYAAGIGLEEEPDFAVLSHA